MPDLSTSQNDASPHAGAVPRRRRHRRSLLVAGAVAAGLAVVGGVAGGVAAMVSRSSPTPTPGGGATLFFPSQGQPQAGPAVSGGGASNQGAAMAAPQGLAAGVPAMAYGAQSGAAYAVNAGSYAYPWYGCGSSPQAQVQGSGITATGMVQVPLPGAAQDGTMTLNASVQSQVQGDVKTALAEVRTRLNAIRDAVHAAGVPAAQISEQNLNVYANGNPKVSNASVNGGLTVTVADASILDRVISAAVDAGATNLNLWTSSSGSAATPTDEQVRSALGKATAQAHAMAEAVAQGAGVTLGSMQASAVQAPSICPWAPGGPQLVAAVTVTYATR